MEASLGTLQLAAHLCDADEEMFLRGRDYALLAVRIVNPEAVLALVKWMQDKGFPLNTNSFNKLIVAALEHLDGGGASDGQSVWGCG